VTIRVLDRLINSPGRDMDISEIGVVAYDMAFERYGKPNRIALISSRRKRD
jgi:hypothetical protein